MTALPTPQDVQAAADRIGSHVRHTPLLRADVDGKPVVLKLEQLQRTGSFKLRGALNALLAGALPARVITASGGNHGLGVATAARLSGIPATVFVPESVPSAKAVRIEQAGAKLVRHGTTYAECAWAAQQQAAADAARYLPAYDHPDVIAGQGTVAHEIVADCPDVDSITVAVGGGGLVAGTTLGGGGRPIVAVEPADCCALHRALAAGEPVNTEVRSVAASALGATKVGELPYAVLSANPPRSVLVDDAAILVARDRLWDEFRLAVEPAGAVPFAAFLAGEVPGELPCLVLCGANSDWTPS